MSKEPASSSHDGADVVASGQLEDLTPAFSTTDRGSRMTLLPLGQPVGKVDAALAAQVILCGVTWALASSVPYAALLGLAPTVPLGLALGSLWAVVSALVVLYVAILLATRLHGRAKGVFGQSRSAGLLTTLAITGGLAVGGGSWALVSFAIEPAPPFDIRNIATAPEIPRELGVLVGGVFAAWALWTLARIPGAVRHARNRQQTIERLRTSGTRHQGVLSEVGFDHLWVFDQPFFTVCVTYDDGGEARAISARMRTTSDRVPVVGTRMIVRTDGASCSVELDSSEPTVFEDEGRYRAPEG